MSICCFFSARIDLGLSTSKPNSHNFTEILFHIATATYPVGRSCA